MRVKISLLWRWLRKVFLSLAAFWFLTVIAFKFLPVPFSAVMIEKQISAWINLNFSYVSHSEWVDENHISPYLYLAVIAAEDQNFPHHWGFDLEAIERAYKHNMSKKKDDSRRVNYLSTNSKKPLVMEWEKLDKKRA